LYDRIVDGFARYETLVDSVASLIERLGAWLPAGF
jgi:hypothetical protein